MPSSLQRAAVVHQRLLDFPDGVLRTDVLGRQHGSVWGGLITISLDLHATGDTGDGLAAGQIGDVDEGVVEGRENAGNAEDELALETSIRAQCVGSSRRTSRTWGPSCELLAGVSCAV